jgi:carboxymethylenebutenolidase
MMLADVDQRHVMTEDLHLANGANAFLARPDAPGPHPSIVALHEIYGLVRHPRELAIRFAADGYVALVPNLWFRTLDQEAVANAEIRPVVSDAEVAQDLGVAIDYLTQLPGADTSQLAVMGACATGRYPLIAAATRPEVTACVIFYGAAYQRDWEPDMVTDYVQRSNAPVLGVYGEFDHLIARDGILRVRNALEAARRSYHIKVFRGVRHAFLDDTPQPQGRGTHPYPRPQGDEAWALLLGFLARVRRGGYPPDRVQWTFETDYPGDYDFSKLQPQPQTGVS